MSKFTFNFDFDSYFGIPKIRIYIDNNCLFDGNVDYRVSVDKILSTGDHQLIIEHYGKHQWQDQNEQHDKHVEIKSILFDEVDLDCHEHMRLSHRGQWHPNYGKEYISPCHWLGNNGKWVLNFQAPVLNWIIDTTNSAGVSPDQTLDKSTKDTLKDTLDFFKINV
jgi:hypothetical protein